LAKNADSARNRLVTSVNAWLRQLLGFGIIALSMTDVENNTARGRDGALCYLAGILFPLIFLTTAPYKTDRFIRFHSFQSVVFTLTCVVIIGTARLLREQTAVVATVLSGAWIVFLITWILLMVKAYQGRIFKLPLVGTLASRWAG